MPRPRVAVVIPTRNCLTMLRNCVQSIMDTTDYPDWELVIVDHGSMDGTIRWAQQQKYIRVLMEPKRGVAAALNTAFRSTGGRDVVRIHSDVIAETRGWLSMLADAAHDLPRAGIVGAKLVYSDDRIQAVGRNIVTGLGIKDRHANIKAFQPDSESLKEPDEVDSVPGAFAYYRRELIEATGGLDEGYWPGYLDDDDFCMMARLRGYKVYVHAGVKGIHFTATLSPTTRVTLQDTDGLLSKIPIPALKQSIIDFHAKHWQAKWGWHPQYPDLSEIRRVYGNTEICWRIGEPMRYRPANRPPSVDVVAVTWNNKDTLQRCLESLAKTDYRNVKVHISDNGSTDGTPEYLKELGKDFPYPLFVYRLAVNTGVAVGLNWAITQGDSELVARIDDDIVLPRDWLEIMVEDFVLRPFAGVIGPKIINDTLKRDIQCGPYRQYPRIYGHEGEPDTGQADYLSRTSHVRGCCNLYRRDALLKSGLFDLRFSPTQFDDPDHHIALLFQGYEVIYDGRVNVIHKLNSGAAKSYASISNNRGNSEKLYGKWGADVWMIIDRAIEQSVEGRNIPLDADLSEFYRQLPPPESYPRDHQVVLDREDYENLQKIADFRQSVLGPDGPLNSFWDDHVVHAANLRRDGDPFLSETVLMGILDYAPRKANILYELARTLEQQGEMKRAALLVKRAMLLEPANQDFRALLARLEHNRSGKIADLACGAKTKAPGDSSAEIGEVSLVSGPCIRGAAKLRVLMLNTFQQRTPGGDMHQIKKTKQYLEKNGIHVDISYTPCPNPKGYDLVHAFNLWFPEQVLPQLKFIRMAAPRCPIVMTPIYWDMREKAWADVAVPKVFANAGTQEELRKGISTLAAQSLLFNNRSGAKRPEPNYSGYEEYQRQILSMVDHLFPQSEREMRVMHETLGVELPYTVTTNAAETDIFDKAGPDWFVKAYGIRDFVITVGLVEPRKNQLMLLHALRDTGIPVVVVGRNYDRNYFRLCRSYAAPSTIFIDHLPHDRLASALKAARVFALPSWMECASFASIEAALAGCSLAVSDRTSEPEYFGDCAYYCDPVDPNSIRQAVLRAVCEYDADASKRERLRQLFTNKYTWELAAEKVLEGYGLAMEKRSGVNEPVMVCSSKSSRLAH